MNKKQATHQCCVIGISAACNIAYFLLALSVEGRPAFEPTSLLTIDLYAEIIALNKNPDKS